MPTAMEKYNSKEAREHRHQLLMKSMAGGEGSEEAGIELDEAVQPFVDFFRDFLYNWKSYVPPVDPRVDEMLCNTLAKLEIRDVFREPQVSMNDLGWNTLKSVVNDLFYQPQEIGNAR